jgi:histone acetyltransferase MYST1
MGKDDDDDDEEYTDERPDSTSDGSRPGSALTVDTKASATPGSTGKTPPSSSSQQDTHPYPRGSVIEVWHVPATHRKSQDDWWSGTSSEEEEAEEESAKRQKTVRLCDVIDRAQAGPDRWRYYVHYRDFNRRMDEWIGMDRIVSPPSVGNTKARALKRAEERSKRLKKKEEEKKKIQKEAAAAAELPRGRRRPVTTVPSVDEGDSGRRPRLSRRKSSVMDDDVTVATSNAGDALDEESAEDALGASSTHEKQAAGHKQKEVVTADAVTTHTVGEHVVATVQAAEMDEHEGLDEASLREHEEVTRVKNVGFLELGRYQMETWYFSPLPKELVSGGSQSNDSSQAAFLEVLYVCEFTFRMFARKSELQRFQARLPAEQRHPPGNEIYRDGSLAMFEVDGLEEKIYCQNLCYIAKLFLDHKTLYYDVDPFLFYVLCEVDDRGFHPVGYYSKEKYSDVGYNLACILSFPAHQRKGYGRFLISFSYELTKKEEKVGSPEKPMSDLGQQAYKPYWASTIIDFLLNQSHESSLSIMDISKKTSIMAEDIVFTLNQLGILKIINGVYFIAAEKNLLQRLAEKYPIKEPRVDPSKLHWTPYLTDVKRDKFSIHSKKPSLEAEGSNGKPDGDAAKAP